MARKEFAATLTSSAVARSVTTTGVPARDRSARTPPAAAPRPAPRRRRRRGGPGAGCPRRRSPRAGTPGSTRARRRRRPGPCGDQAASRAAVPDRDRRLADDERAGRARWRRQRRDGRVDVASGRRRTRPCAAGCRRRRSARRRTPATSATSVVNRSRPDSQVLAQQLLEAGLEERHVAGGQRVDLACVDVDAEHVVAELGHADGVGGAEVAGADDGDPRGPSLAGRDTASRARGIGGRRGRPLAGARHAHAGPAHGGRRLPASAARLGRPRCVSRQRAGG